MDTPRSRIAVDIGHDVSGQAIVGDHNISFSNVQGSTITVLKPGERPEPTLRNPIRLLPRRGPAPLGREKELAELVTAATGGAQVQLYGAAGTGKSTLLRRLTYRLVERGDAVVFLDGSGRDADDLRQDLFEACFDSPGYRPSPVELRRLMTGLEITVVVDDAGSDGAAWLPFLESAPDGCVIWASEQRTLWGEGSAVELTGLPLPATLGLIKRLLGRPLHDAEAASAERVWQFTGGRPLDIVRTVVAADGGEFPTGRNLLQLLLPRLSPASLRILALLHGLGPAPVTPELLRAIFPGPDDAGAVEPLVRLGLVSIGENGYRAELGADLTPTGHLRLHADQTAAASRSAIRWLATASPGQAGTNGPAISRLIKLAGDDGHPGLACELARAAAPLVGRSLRWGSWRTILSRGTTAAERVHDSAALAYFTHEDGIRSLGLGKKIAAGAALGAAFELWRQLGDPGGISAVQNAQSLIPPSGPALPTAGPPPTPPSPGAAGPPGQAAPPGPTAMHGQAVTPGTPPSGSSSGPPSSAGSAPGPGDPGGASGPGGSTNPPGPPSPPPSGGPALPAPSPSHTIATFGTKAGGLVAKLTIGAVVAAGTVGGAAIIRSATDSNGLDAHGGKATIYVTIMSKVLPTEYDANGHTACRPTWVGGGTLASTTVCVAEVDKAPDLDLTYQVVNGDFSGQILHWGCKDSKQAGATQCHVATNGTKLTSVCISTSFDDPWIWDNCRRMAALGKPPPDAPVLPGN